MTGSVKDPCDEGQHRIVKNSDGFNICEKCGLATQSIQGHVGHDLTAEEYETEKPTAEPASSEGQKRSEEFQGR